MNENKFYFIDKPSGITSFDVIRKLRKILQIKRMGHIGTLDPLAHGLMVVATGKFTRLIPFLEKTKKTYQCTFKMDGRTDSMDMETPVDFFSDEEIREAKISEKDFQKKIETFLWKITQIPPKYSAIHINGKRAYKFAYKWEKVKIPTREVEIFSLKILKYNFPEVTIETTVSAGTYIRSLVSDIGKSLGLDGYITDLCRTEIEEYLLRNSISLDKVTEVEGKSISEIFPHWKNMENIFSLEEQWKLFNGMSIKKDCLLETVWYFLYEDRFVLLEKKEEIIQPIKVI